MKLLLAFLFACSAALHAQTFEETYNFRHDGKTPLGRLLFHNGDYYGTTAEGGSSLSSTGVLFRKTPGSAEGQRILRHFQGGSPDGGVTLMSDGNLIGGLRFGYTGSINQLTGNGAIYRVTTDGTAVGALTFISTNATGEFTEHEPGRFLWQSYGIVSNNAGFFDFSPSPFGMNTLRTFNVNSEGQPYAAPIRGLDGKYLLGTRFRIISVDLANANASVTLRSAVTAEGSGYQFGFTQAADGTLYGTTESGGSASAGVVWKMNADGTGYAVLHHFAGGAGGATPRCRLLLHTDDVLYGTTAFGGADNVGTMFKITTDGTFTKLHDFTTAEGQYPRTLIPGRAGKFAGVAQAGGAGEGGTIFEADTAGNIEVVHHFGGVGGYIPSGPLLLASDGNFYGNNAWGGHRGRGAVYRIIPGSPARLEELHSFADNEGRNPHGPLAEGFDGAIYGYTIGNLNGGGTFTSTFRVTKDGQFSLLRPINASNVEIGGGASTPFAPRADGTLFQLATGGVFRTTADGKMFHFANYPNAETPPLAAFNASRLFQQADGSFLYLTSSGGSVRLVRILPAGTISEVSSDSSISLGSTPVVGADGAFWFLGASTSSTLSVVRYPITGARQTFTINVPGGVDNFSPVSRSIVEREPGVFYVVRQIINQQASLPQTLVKLDTNTLTYTDVLALEAGPFYDRRANLTQFIGGFAGAPTFGGIMAPPTLSLLADDNLQITLAQDEAGAGGKVGRIVLPARTGTAPLATTGAASGITITDATLAGEVNPQGAQTFAWIEYGFTTAYGLRGPSVDAGNGSAPVAVQTPIALLRGSTTYHFRTVAASAAGVTYGADQTFTTGPNQSPIALDDTAGVRLTSPYQPVQISPLTNDTDADSDPLTIVTFTDPVRGSVTRNGNVFTYTPNQPGNASPFNASGDSFNYLISDGKGGEAAGIVNIVAGANSAPVAVDDTIFIRAKETLTISPLVNDTDADNDTLTVQGNSAPAAGTVTRAGAVLTYKPGKFFAGADNFTYTISDGFGGQDTGTIAIVNPFLAYDGNYEALVGDNDGLVTAKVSGGGLLTGKIKLGAKTYVLKGLVGFGGAFTQTIKRKGLADLVVSLTFAAPGSIVGTVAGSVSEQFTIAQNAILATTLPAPAVAGKYTLLLEPDALTIPAPLNAYGWATAQLTAKGVFVMVGVTPDGKPLVLQGKMRTDTAVTLFLSAPAPKSAFVGSFTFADDPESDFSGALRWTRGPITKGIFLGAIDTTFAIRGCRFTPPLKGVRTLTYSDLINATGQLDLTGGGLAPDITRIFAISTADKATLAIGQANPELVKITRIDRAAGRFEGTFKHPALAPRAAPVKFRGIQLQKAGGGTGPNKAFGTFTIPTAAGTATFTPQ